MQSAKVKRVYTKYKYTPWDIAVYSAWENLSCRRQTEVIKDLFSNFNSDIVYPYRENYLMFKNSIADLLIVYGLSNEEYSEAELIMNEIGSMDLYEPDNEYFFGAYFKLIKLQLLYSGISYRKIKLKNLLRDFGYKRRTPELVTNINNALFTLGLRTYLKGYEPCSIADVSIHDMIIIRLE